MDVGIHRQGLAADFWVFWRSTYQSQIAGAEAIAQLRLQPPMKNAGTHERRCRRRQVAAATYCGVVVVFLAGVLVVAFFAGVVTSWLAGVLPPWTPSVPPVPSPPLTVCAR